MELSNVWVWKISPDVCKIYVYFFFWNFSKKSFIVQRDRFQFYGINRFVTNQDILKRTNVRARNHLTYRTMSPLRPGGNIQFAHSCSELRRGQFYQRPLCSNTVDRRIVCSEYTVRYVRASQTRMRLKSNLGGL